MIEDEKSFPFVGREVGGGQTGYEPTLGSNRETLLQDHSTAAGRGITAEVTQKSRGNFVLTSQGTFQRFSSHDSTATKKKKRAARRRRASGEEIEYYTGREGGTGAQQPRRGGEAERPRMLERGI